MPVFCFAGSVLAGSTPLAPQAKLGDPLPGLTATQRGLFEAGRFLYNEPLADTAGLGPIFNKSSCGNCHNTPLGGPGSQTVTRFALTDKGEYDPLEQFGGSLLQELSITPGCEEVVDGSANLVTERVTNGMMGYGLVEAIPDDDLLDNRDLQPVAQRGTAHMVTAFEDPVPPPPQPPILHVGRFGWKAQVPTMLTFSADAARNEMGLTNRFVQTENDPNGINPPALGDCDVVADPEDHPDANGFDFIDRVTHFQRYLAAPPQTPRSGMAGERLFTTAGCAVCHTPTFTTSSNPSLEDAIRSKTIHPYSDFLLHQMGTAGDFHVHGAGTAGMVKTPPLWGMRIRDPMWHDGRVAAGTLASRVQDVVDLHAAPGSQAITAANNFNSLSSDDKAKVVAFLDSLGKTEFDHDFDGDVQLDDFVQFANCYGTVVNPNLPCAISDVDQDTDVDLDDFLSFALVYVGPRRDCNSNGVIDLQDMLTGVLLDGDDTGFPDSCEPTCTGDVNGTGVVEVNDLLAVIGLWGTCPPMPAPCAGDIDFNGVVNVNDLLGVIGTWGNCP